MRLGWFKGSYYQTNMLLIYMILIIGITSYTKFTSSFSLKRKLFFCLLVCSMFFWFISMCITKNTPFCRFGRQYHLGSKINPRVVQLDWLWILAHTNDNKENQSCKGQFQFRRFAIFEYHEEMFTKLVNKNIYIDCLVPFFRLLTLKNMVKEL